MKILKLHDAYREAFAVWEALRRLGFPSDDIWFQRSVWFDPTCEVVRVVLKTPSENFVIDTGLITLKQAETFEETMHEASTAIKDGHVPQRDLDKLWRQSQIGSDTGNFLALILALKNKGIDCPAVQN